MKWSANLEIETIKPVVHHALRSWKKGDAEPLLMSLHLLRQLLDESELTPREAINHLLTDCMAELEEKDAQAARVLFRRFVQGKTLIKVGQETELGQFAVSRVQSAGIEQLTAILCQRETALRRALSRELESILPPSTYEQLFGFDEAQSRLLEQLLRQNGPWLLAATGIGGIGKTAIADSVTRQALRTLHFRKVHWVRIENQSMGGARATPKLAYEKLLYQLAEQMNLDVVDKMPAASREPRIHAILKAEPTLVVIDNLEDEGEVNYLLPRLRHLAEPSKFLLTTRSRPSNEMAVFCQPLGELSLNDAAALLRYQAECNGLESLAAAGEADIERIYGVTGGNPLALKLVVGLVDRFSLPDILDDLTHGHITQTDKMYRRIYERAWEALSGSAQTLLQAMPLVSRSIGGDLDQLQAFSELPAEQVRQAVDELTKRNLLEARGNLKQQRYGIHRLTETFLTTVIIGWFGEEI